jgi:hypothetical protein
MLVEVVAVWIEVVSRGVRVGGDARESALYTGGAEGPGIGLHWLAYAALCSGLPVWRSFLHQTL